MIKVPETDTHFRRKKNPLETWGAAEFEIARRRLKHFRTCLDIGAHVGVMTLRYAKHFNVVHSFEPLVYEYLEANTEHLSNVVIHKYAVSDTSRTVEMYPNPKNSTGGIIDDEYSQPFIRRRYTGRKAPLSKVKKVQVECVSIDQFNFQNVDLIKVDVEGHIIPVTKGMIQTLTDNDPVVQMEMSAFDDINIQVHKMFTNLGYSRFDIYRTAHLSEWFYQKR